MKHAVAISIALGLVLSVTLSISAVPKVMAVSLAYEQDGVYSSDIFHLPISVCNATLDISVLMDTFLKATLELRAGNNYIQFHLNDLSISGHLEYDIFDLFAKVTAADISLKLLVDTDGIIQGSPKISIVYYGIF